MEKTAQAGSRGHSGISTGTDTITTDTAGRDIAKANLMTLVSLMKQVSELAIKVTDYKGRVERSVIRYGKLEVAGVANAEMKIVKGATDTTKKALIKTLGEAEAVLLWAKLPRKKDKERLAINLSK